jgi:predicted Zn-dependent protease
VLRTILQFFVFGFALAAFLAPTSAWASAKLVGVVYSEASNQRLAHVSVWLYDDGGGNRLLESVTTDNGEFAFPGIREGAYVLKINAPGFLPLEMNVEVNFSTERGISVFLRPEGKSHKKSATGAAISAHELSMPAAARKLVDSGKKKLYAGNNPEAALHDFEAAVWKAPDYYEAYYQLGMAYLSLQKTAEAEKNLQTSVALSKQTYADAVLALAILLLGRHESAEGEPLLRRGLELNPNSWVGYYELGKLELYRMHLEPALDAAHSAQSLAPQQPKVYRLLSLIHLRQKNYPAALTDLDAYIRLDPGSPEGQTAKQIRDDTARRLQTAANP